MPYVPSKLNPNLEVLGEVQEFNFPNTQNRGRVDIRTELVPTADVPTQSGLTLKDSAFNGYRFEYESCLDATQNKLGLYKVTNNVRADTAILWIDNTGKVTFNSEAFAQAPTLDGHVATKKYVDDHSGGGGGDATKAYVDQQDAATLDSAKTYTDGKIPSVTTVETANLTYKMTTPSANLFSFNVLGGLTQQGWMKNGSFEFDYSDYSFKVHMTPGENLGAKPYIDVRADRMNFGLRTLEQVNSSTNSQGVLNKYSVEQLVSQCLTEAKTYTDNKPSGLPIDANGIIAANLAGKLTPAWETAVDTGKILNFVAKYDPGYGTCKDGVYIDTSSRQIGFKISDTSGSITPLLVGNGFAQLNGTALKLNSSNTSYAINFRGSASAIYGWDVQLNYASATSANLAISCGSNSFINLVTSGSSSYISAQQTLTMPNNYTPSGVNDVATKGTIDGAVPIGGELTCPKNFTPTYGTWMQCNGGTYATDGSYSTLQSRLTAAGRVAGVLPTRTAPDSFTWVLIRVK